MNAQQIAIVGVKSEPRVNEVKSIVTNHTAWQAECFETLAELETINKSWQPTLLVYVMSLSRFAQITRHEPPQLPTFLVISQSEPTEEIEPLLSRVDDFIFAPFDTFELVTRLKYVQR